MDQPLFFKIAVQIQGFRLGEAVKGGIFGPDIGRFPARPPLVPSIFSAIEDQAETILGIRPSFVHLAADTRYADDGTGEI